jgi:putative oxidoreductase
VHWPAEWNTWPELLRGYTLTDDGFGNYKLAASFIAMLVPLFLCGPGRLSIDHWLHQRAGRTVDRHNLRPA